MRGGRAVLLRQLAMARGSGGSSADPSYLLGKQSVAQPEDHQQGEWSRQQLEQMNSKFCEAMLAQQASEQAKSKR
jgi:hypothetical protein